MKQLLFTLLGLTAVAYAQTGNVGIGTTAPSDQLHTTGAVRFQKYSGQGTRLVQVDSTGRLVVARNEAVYGMSTPASIPDAGCTGGLGVSSALTITGQAQAVPSASIAVRVDITHTYTADLRIFLEAPNGDLLNLAFAVGGGGDNFSGTIFSDEAALSIASGTAPFSGSYKPQGVTSAVCAVTPTVGSFGAIGGGSTAPNGVWRLRVYDATGADTGALNSWSISFGGASSISTAAETGAVPYFSSGGLEASKIFSAPSGNIGVRTTAPTAALDVAGTFRLRSAGAAPGKVLTSLDSAGNTGWMTSAAGLSNTYVLSRNAADAALLGADYSYNSSVLLSTQSSYSTMVASGAWTRCSHFLRSRKAPAVIKGAGNKFIVFGGYDGMGSHSDGAIYDPVEDTWTAIPDMAEGTERTVPAVVWTGSKLLVWGGSAAGANQYLNTGKIYDTTTRMWTAMSATGAPAGRYVAAYGYNAATNEFVVWGGRGSASQALGDGAKYNLTTNTWTAISTTNAPSGRSRTAFAFGGGKLFISGGYVNPSTNASSAHLYDCATNTWQTLPASGLGARYSGCAEHTGSAFIVWGGSNGASINSGAVYNTLSGTWTAMSTNGAPAYSAHESAFANGQFVVCGAGGTQNYEVAVNSWQTLNFSGNSTRVFHGMAANATCVFLWGGQSSQSSDADDVEYGERYFWSSQPVKHHSATPLELHLYKKN